MLYCESSFPNEKVVDKLELFDSTNDLSHLVSCGINTSLCTKIDKHLGIHASNLEPCNFYTTDAPTANNALSTPMSLLTVKTICLAEGWSELGK